MEATYDRAIEDINAQVNSLGRAIVMVGEHYMTEQERSMLVAQLGSVAMELSFVNKLFYDIMKRCKDEGNDLAKLYSEQLSSDEFRRMIQRQPIIRG